MTLVRFLKAKPYAPDGIHVQHPEVGTVTELPVQLTEAFLASGVVELAGDAPAAPVAAPDAPPVQVLPDGCEGACAGEPGGCACAAATPADLERPAEDAPRKELDAYALAIGVPSAAVKKATSKKALNEVLDAVEVARASVS